MATSDYIPANRDLLDMLTDPVFADTFKKGQIARVPVARVGDKVLSILFEPNSLGELEVSSEWGIYSANSDYPKERTVENAHRFCVVKKWKLNGKNLEYKWA